MKAYGCGRGVIHRETQPVAESIPRFHRTCCRCKRVLPNEAFGLDSNAATGFSSYCRECWSAIQRESRARRREREGR